jgi:hypothetical protein
MQHFKAQGRSCKRRISAESYAGATSTTIPTTFIPRNPRIIFIALSLVYPPQTGVPLPGALAGSTQSMSNVMYNGISTTRARTCSTMCCAVKSLAVAASTTSKPWPSLWYSVRIPLCIKWSTSINPSRGAW